MCWLVPDLLLDHGGTSPSAVSSPFCHVCIFLFTVSAFFIIVKIANVARLPIGLRVFGLSAMSLCGWLKVAMVRWQKVLLFQLMPCLAFGDCGSPPSPGVCGCGLV